MLKLLDLIALAGAGILPLRYGEWDFGLAQTSDAIEDLLGAIFKGSTSPRG
jgi:hypothetical protein